LNPGLCCSETRSMLFYSYLNNMFHYVLTQSTIPQQFWALSFLRESHIPLGTSWLNQRCFNVLCQHIVTWILLGKYIGFAKSHQLLLWEGHLYHHGNTSST
jgi:hypothetical protein